METIRVFNVRVVPTAKKLERVPSAKPRVYPVTASGVDKLLITLNTIVSLDYYIAGIEEA